MQTSPGPKGHPVSGTARWRRCAVGLGLLALTGCIGPGVLPGMPLARYAPIPASNHGTVTASAQVAYASGGGTSFFAFPLGAAGLTLALAPRYDLSIDAGAGSAVVEGNFLLVDGPLRLGLVHGAGLSLSSGNGSNVATTAYQLRAGLLLGEPGHSHLVAELGWVYAGEVASALGSTGTGTTSSNGFHTLFLSVGYPDPVGGFVVTPEVMIMKTFGFDTGGQNADLFGVTGAISLTAPF